jgi:hypothetical protein
MDKYLIYGLYCPFTDSLHYVGKSTIGMIRPNSHMTKSHSEKINEWVSCLKFFGYSPIVKILEVCNENSIDSKEIEWINKSINDGCYLLNVSHNSSDNILLKKEYDFDNKDVIKIGGIIKKTRLLKDMSTIELSHLSKISRPTLLSLEKGINNIALSNLIKVLKVLDLEIKIINKNSDETECFNSKNEPRVRVIRRKNQVSATP